jgi:pimeloyl-ACP methyl ester carboxylesterase
MTIESAAVFVHGIFSSPRTWESLLGLLKDDIDISAAYDLRPFEYQSPAVRWCPSRRIPDFNTIADSLSTFIEVDCAKYNRLVLVSHSQGGLIIQRYLARMLAQSRGVELAKVRRIVLLACPNSGSDLLLLARKAAVFWKHPQERELRPVTDAVVEAQRTVLASIVHASSLASDRCPIPIAVYAGETDNIVTPASAKFVFPQAGALPGDHHSILRADSTTNRTFTTLKANLLRALREPPPTPHQAPVRTPVIKFRNMTTKGDASRSQEIEIFDAEVADLWIRVYGTSSTTQPEQNDVE